VADSQVYQQRIEAGRGSSKRPPAVFTGRRDISAYQFLNDEDARPSTAQWGILQRVSDYSLACRMWALNMATRPGIGEHMDHTRCNDLARMAATLALIAFPDLRG
jgi:hypothetical protein